MSTSKWSLHNGTGTNTDLHNKSVKAGLDRGTLKRTDGGRVEFDFTNRVREGMATLDKVAPGWQDEINLPVLDLEDDEMCVLGQAWPHYARLRGLADVTGDYKAFSDAVLNVGGAGLTPFERNEMASAIGCALDNMDFGVIDTFADEEWERRHPGTKPTNCPEWDQILMETLAKVWEALTKTWITEITKAREEGRWDERVSETPPQEQADIPEVLV